MSGASWLSGTKAIGIRNLRSKILCKRHNECLTHLDSAAGKLFKHVAAIYQDLRDPSPLRKASWYLCSGQMLELWGLKVIFGLHRSGTASASGTPIRDFHALAVTRFVQALSAKRLDPPMGLYCFTPKEARTLTVRMGVSVTSIGTEDPPKIGGAEIKMHGLALNFVYDPSAIAREWVEGRVYRPRYLIFRNAHRRHTILLTWPEQPLMMPAIDVVYRGEGASPQ